MADSDYDYDYTDNTGDDSGNSVDPNNYMALANAEASNDPSNDSGDNTKDSDWEANDKWGTHRKVHDMLVGLGVKPNTAAGAIGSLMGEGGRFLDPNSLNPGDGSDGSDSRGFGQWNGTRARNLMATAKELGTSWNDPDAQIEHLKRELTGEYSNGNYSGVLNALKNAPDSVANGANIWTRQYERPKNPDLTMKARTSNGVQIASILQNGANAPTDDSGNTDTANNSGGRLGGTGDVNTVSTSADNTGTVQGQAPMAQALGYADTDNSTAPAISSINAATGAPAQSPALPSPPGTPAPVVAGDQPNNFMSIANAAAAQQPKIDPNAVKSAQGQAPAPATKPDDDSEDDTTAAQKTPTATDQLNNLKQNGPQPPAGIGASGLNPLSILGGAFQKANINPMAMLGAMFSPNAANAAEGTQGPDMSKFGNAMIKVGAALMARDNPSGAQALLGMIDKTKDKDKEKEDPKVRASSLVVNQNGEPMMRSIMSDGTVKVSPVDKNAVSPAEVAKANPAPKVQADKMSQAEGRLQAESSRQVAQSANQVEKSQELQDAIISGKFNPAWDGRLGAFVDNSTGHSTENSRYIKDLNSLVNRSTLTTMSYQKGSPTDARTKFDLQSIFPQGSQYDAATVFSSLNRVKEVAQENLGGSVGTLAAMADRHPTVASNMYIGKERVANVNDWMKGRQDSWDKKDSDLMDRYGTWVQQHDHPKAKAPPASDANGGTGFTLGNIFGGGSKQAAPASNAGALAGFGGDGVGGGDVSDGGTYGVPTGPSEAAKSFVEKYGKKNNQ